jgi:hypothetical protein
MPGMFCPVILSPPASALSLADLYQTPKRMTLCRCSPVIPAKVGALETLRGCASGRDGGASLSWTLGITQPSAGIAGGQILARQMLSDRQLTGANAMSISSIASTPNWWSQQYEATQVSQSSSGTTGATSSTSTGSVSNTGTTASPTNPLPFFVDFASDLQAMLAQMTGQTTGAAGTSAASQTSTTAATGTTTTADTNTEDQTTSADGTHHHHHHGRDDGSMQGDATQLVGEATQTMQNPTAGAGNVVTAAGTFATDVVQALQAYGGTAALASAAIPIA